MFKRLSSTHGSCVTPLSFKRYVKIFVYFLLLDKYKYYVFSFDMNSMYIIECTWRNVITLFNYMGVFSIFSM
jgi:hypothetical protein